jgi:hypothetical protein
MILELNPVVDYSVQGSEGLGTASLRRGLEVSWRQTLRLEVLFYRERGTCEY